MTDSIADLLTRVRNAIQARQQTVTIPTSKTREAIVKILQQEGFISQYVKEDAKPQAQLRLFLKYDGNKKSVIHSLRRVSKPGGRCYKGYKETKPFLKGMGLTILSTPKGVLTDSQARQMKVGGEVLCEIC